jgi:resuscitation-promoting factor RpfA
MADDNAVADDRLDELIHRADLDALVRMIDDRCSTRDWAGLLRVRDRARHAVDTGRQLWPAATLAEYRLALLAPPEFVAAVLDETDGLSGRFTIGPLTEVAAQHHTWDELRAVLEPGPRSTFVAHERVLRGDRVVTTGLPAVLDLPLELHEWEPTYALATYSDAGAEFPMPELAHDWTDVRPAPAEVLDDEVELAVRQLVEPWLTGSNGRVEVVCVEGDVAGALGALGLRRARVAELDAATALAWLAWAGASGGAHGRRRGAASGRFGAWWTLAALGDLLDDWPIPPDELGALAHELRWYRWDAHEPALGWQLQLAVEDPSEGVAWAILARDAV